jgi:hypothetical protein
MQQDSDKVMSSMQHGVELDQLFDKLRTIKRREHTVFKCQQVRHVHSLNHGNAKCCLLWFLRRTVPHSSVTSATT